MKYSVEKLEEAFLKMKVLSISKVKQILGTNSSATAARKLKEINAVSCYSHAGGYYTLSHIPLYDKNGLWSYNDIWFSVEGTCLKTICRLIRESEEGFFCYELDALLHIKTGNSLTKLYRERILSRRQINSKYLYLWPELEKLQLKKRMTFFLRGKIVPGYENAEMKYYLKSFLDILNEKQKRLFLGFESMKYGRGGDYAIAEISGINRKTIGKGRRELEAGNINMERIRIMGGGRKGLKKKKY